MARTPQQPPSKPDQRVLYRCTDPFSIWNNGVPTLYAGDREVLEDDPILKTHRHHFEPASQRVANRPRIEEATAVPGEIRGPVLPPRTDTQEEKFRDE